MLSETREARSTRTLYRETISHPLYDSYDRETKATLVHIVMTVNYRDIVKKITMSQSNMAKLVGCERDKMIRVYNLLNKDGWLPQKEKRAGTSNEYVFEIPLFTLDLYSPDTGDVSQDYTYMYSPNTETSIKQEIETNDSDESVPSRNVLFDPYRDKSLSLVKDDLDLEETIKEKHLKEQQKRIEQRLNVELISNDIVIHDNTIPPTIIFDNISKKYKKEEST